MEQQHTRAGVWSETTRVAILNLGPCAFYVVAMIVIAVASEFMKSNSGLTVAQAVAAAVLAIPAHLTVLRNVSGFDAMKGSNYFGPFFLRSVGLGVLSLAPAIILMIILLVQGTAMPTAFTATGLVALLIGSAVFAKWGTMLPATVMDADKSIAAAGRRGSLTFGYAFPMLLLAFGLLTLLQLAVVFGLYMIFPTASEAIFPEGGGIGIVSILSGVLASAIGAYQVVMTAVILSRSFQKAEAAAGA